MSRATEKRFENYMYFDFNKGPNGSCEWISRVLSDKTLTFEAVGLLLVMGEQLINSSFGIGSIIKLRPRDPLNDMWFIHLVLDLVEKGYFSITWCKDGTTDEDKADYWVYLHDKLKADYAVPDPYV